MCEVGDEVKGERLSRRPELAPPDFYDPVIEAYKKDVDRTLLRENLKLTVEGRIRKAQRFHQAIAELQALLEERRKMEEPPEVGR